MALTKIGTDGVKDDAVTSDKVANSINSAIAANTAKTQTTINNNADNRVITGSGTANTLNAESNVIVDSSGRLLIGTTTEGEVSSDDLTIATDAHTGMTIRSGTSHDGTINFSDGTSGADEYRGWLQYNHTGNHMIIGTDASENARFFRSGSHGYMYINTTSQVAGAMLSATGNGTCVIGTKVTADNTQPHIRFTNPNGEVGSVSTNGSSTSFNTSSDYRLKENVVGISDGITRLKTLKPSRFNFKVDKDTTVDGFLAHEVTAVPEAISGTKDAVDSDNNPIYQGIDQSKLVPLLTAALQEAIAKIETLETKVAALEAA